MGKWFWLILVGAVGLLIGLFIFLDEGDNGSDVSFEAGQDKVLEGDHFQGPGDASVTVIEYGDFQCQFCASFYPLAKQLKQDYPEDVDFVFRHFPLTNLHPNAMAAHRAAEAAGNQDKFFEMHDVLYERQSLWSQQSNVAEVFESYAEELGLDMEKFRADVASQETFDVISAQIQSGTDLGLTSTPSIFINGQRIDTPRTYEELKAKVEEALSAANNS